MSCGFTYYGVKNMWVSIIIKNNQEYFLGTYKEKNDAKNIAIIAKTFSDIKDFQKWYSNRKEIYDWLVDKCNIVDISCSKVIQAIYDGHYGELYNDREELNMFINDFKSGYEEGF